MTKLMVWDSGVTMTKCYVYLELTLHTPSLTFNPSLSAVGNDCERLVSL